MDVICIEWCLRAKRQAEHVQPENNDNNNKKEKMINDRNKKLSNKYIDYFYDIACIILTYLLPPSPSSSSPSS